MQGWYAWAKSRVVSLRSIVKETFSQVSAIGYAIYSSPLIWKISFDNLLQFWEGLSRLFNPSIITALLRSKNSRLVLRKSLSANLALYMGSVLLYEGAVKPILRKTIPEMEESQAEKATDFLATIYITRIAIAMFVDNTIYNVCLNKASAENPSETIIEPCPCGTTAMIRASLASPFYYFGNIITANMIGSALPLGEYTIIPLRALIYGQCFVEYKLGMAGLCTAHRYQELLKNNGFCFGLGLSFLTTLYLCNDVVYRATHVESVFVNDALFCCLFQHYIMLAQLIDKPLTGDKVGVDVFYHSRLIVETVLKQTCDWIVPRLRNPETRGYLEKGLQKTSQFPPIRLMRKVFLESSLQSSELFMRRSAVELFFDMYGEGIQTAIAEIRKIRETPSIKRLQKFSPYLPNFILSQEVRNVLNIILTENLDQILAKVDNFTAIARIKVVIYDQNRIDEINSDLNHDFFRSQVHTSHPLLENNNSIKSLSDDFQLIPEDEHKDVIKNNEEEKKQKKDLPLPIQLNIIDNYSGMHTDTNFQKAYHRRKRKNKPSNTEISEPASSLKQNGLFQNTTSQSSPTKLTKFQKVLQWRVRQ